MFVDEFTYTLKDSDGSTDQADLTIKVKDTSPDALDDKDCVVEGGMTLGNVITGEDPDTDPNMLVPDVPSQDVPITILSVDGQTDDNNDGEIEVTGQYGTLVIDTETGAYKYTSDRAARSPRDLSRPDRPATSPRGAQWHDHRGVQHRWIRRQR